MQMSEIKLTFIIVMGTPLYRDEDEKSEGNDLEKLHLFFVEGY